MKIAFCQSVTTDLRSMDVDLKKIHNFSLSQILREFSGLQSLERTKKAFDSYQKPPIYFSIQNKVFSYPKASSTTTASGFHSFRHTHATMLAEAGAPIKYTQEQLGHKDVTVTMQIYQHASEAIRKSGAATLERMFGKAE